MPPITYQVLHDRALVLTQVTGVVTSEDILGHLGILAADPEVQPGYVSLVDLTEVTDFQVRFDGMKEVAERERQVLPDLRLSRTAFVSDRDQVYGTLRILQSLSEDAPTEIACFRSLGEAREWLGLET